MDIVIWNDKLNTKVENELNILNMQTLRMTYWYANVHVVTGIKKKKRWIVNVEIC